MRRGRDRLAAPGMILIVLVMAWGCGGSSLPQVSPPTSRAFAPSGGVQWSATGGPGGPVTAVAVDPTLASVLYARSGSRLFKSTDAGVNWSALSLTIPVTTPAPAFSGSALLVSATVYVGGVSRVYRSSDGGFTWSTSAEMSDTVLCSTGTEPIVARQVLSLAQGASALYAGTTSGVFKSTDGGQTWRTSGNGLIDPCKRASQQFILQIIVDPATPTTLYAGGLGGAFKSADSGANWTIMHGQGPGQGLTSASQGLGNVTVTAMALHPTAPTAVYLATAGGGKTVAAPSSLRLGPGLISMMVGQVQQLAPVVVDSAGNQVGLETLTWSSTDASIAAVSATGLVSAVAAGSVFILASLTPIGLASITSNLVSVTVTATGITGSPVTVEIFPELASIQVGATQQFAVTIKDIAGRTLNNLFLQSFSWATNNTAVLALSSTGLATGLSGGFATVTALLSVSPGTSPITGGLPSKPAAVTVSHGLVFQSPDRGLTWSRRSTGLPPGISISAVVIHPNTPATLYAGTSAGVYRSADAGLTWSATGLQAIPVTTLAVSSQGVIYAGGVNGLFKSQDTNVNAPWTNVGRDLTTTSVTALAVNSAVSTLYAGTDGGGVFVSANSGLWSARSAGLGHMAVSALAWDALANLLYAGTWGGGAFKSADGGTTWTATGTLHPFVAAMLADPLVASTAYAATNGGGVYKTTNGGASWSLTGLVSVNALSLAFDPAGATTLYAGTTNGVFKSQDRGLTWASAGLDQPAPARGLGPGAGQVVFALAQGTATLYAGTNGGGVFKSTDAGATWTAVNSGLTNLTVFAVAVDSVSSSIVYAGTPAGTFRSLNGGLAWAAFSDGLTDLSAQALLTNGSALYAGTRAGVFKAQ